MIDENDPVYRAAFAPFQALMDANADAMDRIGQEGEERLAAMKAEQEARAEQLVAEKAEREAAKAEAKPAEDAKPENAWAQPTRRADSAARIGRFDDDDTPLPVSDAPTPPPAPAAPAPVAAAPPVVTPSPEPAPAGRHRLDDEDDFEGGSFVRG